MPATRTAPALPPITLAAFEGPLDLLLHLIREHRVQIADIPIVQITDHYLSHLRAMEAMNLSVAGEFFVLAATLLEIKSRTLLPKPPRTEDTDEGEDPRRELAQRLEDYARYKALVDTLAGWEDERRALFFRAETDYGGQYALPPAFGAFSSRSLLQALERLLAEAGDDGGQAVTSVRRQKITLRLAMAALWRRIERGGAAGVGLDECFERPLVRLAVVMTFLALLELLRQGRVDASQDALLGDITIHVREAARDA